MQLIVTGGTGFIGSHFLNAAVSAGHDVFATKRRGSLSRISVSDSVHWIDSDLADVDFREFTDPQHTCLVHLAAYGVSPQTCEWEQAFDINVRKTIGMHLKAAKHGIRKFIVCGTCMEYGSVGDLHEWIPPEAPLHPRGSYASSKAAQSVALEGLAREQQLQLTILRPFTVYGDGQHASNFWPSLKKAAQSGEDFPMTTGEQIRDFTPVDVVANEFLRTATSTTLIPGVPLVRNIGTGKPQTLRAFAEHWWKHWNAQGNLLFGAIPQRKGEVMRYVPQI
jgi:nucleoside-diphosphate-sugar epimerase